VIVLPVTPTIEVIAAPPQAVLEAHVKAATPTRLTWRLMVVTGARGASSQITQRGETDGADRGPLATVGVNNPGEAALEVYQDGRLVAQTHRRFGAGGASQP
jgi:hypothetical protein